jgi:DNA invertase Pin-like site-specific DNA recombinase
MKRAALYARVSTDKQQQQQTIESKVIQLKRQIARALHLQALSFALAPIK